MGQVFVRRTTAALLFLVAVLCIVCVALLVLLLAPDWRDTGGYTSSGRLQDTTTTTTTRNPPQTTWKTPTQRTNPPTTQAPSISTTEKEEPKEPWEANYRIPRTTLPHHYDLYLHPDLDTGRFSGRVGILIGVTAPMTYLVAHIKYMNVTRTELKGQSGDVIPLQDQFEYEPNQFWVVLPRDTLQPGNYTLNLDFEGSLDGSIVGFYRSVYTTKAGEKR